MRDAIEPDTKKHLAPLLSMDLARHECVYRCSDPWLSPRSVRLEAERISYCTHCAFGPGTGLSSFGRASNPATVSAKSAMNRVTFR